MLELLVFLDHNFWMFVPGNVKRETLLFLSVSWFVGLKKVKTLFVLLAATEGVMFIPVSR